jgi:hypothetical protein
LEAWFKGISKLSMLNLEKPKMGDQMESSLLEGKSQSRSSYDWIMVLGGLDNMMDE